MSAAIAMSDGMPPITKLTKDLRNAAKTLTQAEARYLVDYYYQMQDSRIRAANQVRALSESGEPHEVILWLSGNTAHLESEIKKALLAYAAADPVGEWAMSVVGIGPVIAAGLLAHIDIEKAPTVGHIWRFAGLDPTQKWEKKTKRPWNAQLKTLCWKIGESFVKTCNNERSFYGPIYTQRKQLEIERNDASQFAGQAEAMLVAKKFDKSTDAYKNYITGKLPPAHIHRRACRYAVKLFLSHFHEKAYIARFGVMPPKPYPIAHLDHAHKIEAPE